MPLLDRMGPSALGQDLAGFWPKMGPVPLVYPVYNIPVLHHRLTVFHAHPLQCHEKGQTAGKTAGSRGQGKARRSAHHSITTTPGGARSTVSRSTGAGVTVSEDPLWLPAHTTISVGIRFPFCSHARRFSPYHTHVRTRRGGRE